MTDQQELRQRREALAQAVNSHDLEAVLSFIHPTFVGKTKGVSTIAGYQEVVRMLEQLLAPGTDYQETVAIEDIEVSGDSARLVVRRVARGRSCSEESRTQETWRLIDGRWLLVEGCEEQSPSRRTFLAWWWWFLPVGLLGPLLSVASHQRRRRQQREEQERQQRARRQRQRQEKQDQKPGDKQDQKPGDRQADNREPARVLLHDLRGITLYSLAFSPDGKTLASAGGLPPNRGEVKLWDVATAKPLTSLYVEGLVLGVAFSPDGKLLATAIGHDRQLAPLPGEVRLWDPTTGKLIRRLEGHSDPVLRAVAFSPDSKVVASGSVATDPESKKPVGEIKLWDVSTGKVLRTLRGHAGMIRSLAFSSDGKILASCARVGEGKVKLWDVAAGTELATLTPEVEIADSVAFAPKEATIAVGGGTPGKDGGANTGQVSLWNTVEKKQLKSFKVPSGYARCVGFSSKGDLLVCACGDSVKVYDVAKQVEVQTLPAKSTTRAAAFSPDDEFIAAGSDGGTVNLWSVAKVRR
jgi:WD40 repeat protein